jgi:hypothetical protein
MNLSQVKLIERIHEFEYQTAPTFKVQIRYLSKGTFKKLRDDNTVTVWKRGKQTADLNERTFYNEYSKAAIVGWSGLTVGIFKTLVPADVEGESNETVIPYTQEIAEFLMVNSKDFDVWVTALQDNLAAFETEEKAAAEKN